MQLMIYLVAYGEICGAYGDFMKFDLKNSEMWTGNIVGGRRKTRRIKQEESE